MKRLPKIGICITSLGASGDELKKLKQLVAANPRLKGTKIFGDIRACDMFDSRPVADRLASLSQASQESDIVIAWNGGFNAIELLPKISTAPINPNSIFVGYSDNTILANTLPATGRAKAYMGPMAANWLRTPEYVDMWLDCLAELYNRSSKAITERYNRAGLTVLRPGTMQGKIWGGNNYTFDLLQGTPFAPDFNEPFILLLEGEDFVTAKNRIWSDFVRNLDSIMLQPGARKNLRGLLIAKFPDSAGVSAEQIETSLRSRDYLQSIPIAYNVARGYAQPSLYLPIGENVQIELYQDAKMNLRL